MKFKELRESYKDKMATQSSENGISPETHVELTKESVEVVDEAAGKYSKSGDNLMYKWGDVNKALMNAGLNPRAILNVLTGLSKKEVK